MMHGIATPAVEWVGLVIAGQQNAAAAPTRSSDSLAARLA